MYYYMRAQYIAIQKQSSYNSIHEYKEAMVKLLLPRYITIVTLEIDNDAKPHE